jgi:hypothetical protein
MNDRTFDMNTWMETYKEAFSSFGKAQQDSFKALERFARFHYAVAGDVLEAGIAQAKATLAPKVAAGTSAVADLLQKQADLGTELSDKLKSSPPWPPTCSRPWAASPPRLRTVRPAPRVRRAPCAPRRRPPKAFSSR